jgi:hypothetical protein
LPNPPITALFDGPIDVIGDVHGEIEPLQQLLSKLGYDATDRHPRGRRLVFVGDLTDRGPDSPAVLDLVRALVGRGLAQCLLGNHELNLLRGDLKSGNEWFVDPMHARAQPGGEFVRSKPAADIKKSMWLKFLASLPLALERDDLRVVHAAWVPSEIAALRAEHGSTTEIYDRFTTQTRRQLEMEGVLARARQEQAEWGTRIPDRLAMVPLLPGIAERDERFQMGSPVRVATSGVERMARVPFWSSGRWRMCQRVNWWEEYDEPVPVIIGHYWRQAKPVLNSTHAASKPQTFATVGPLEWVGLRKNVYCVDFSIGARYQERQQGMANFESHLAALRWPEKELWFETGQYGVAA